MTSLRELAQQRLADVEAGTKLSPTPVWAEVCGPHDKEEKQAISTPYARAESRAETPSPSMSLALSHDPHSPHDPHDPHDPHRPHAACWAGAVRPHALKNNNNINILSFYKSDRAGHTVRTPIEGPHSASQDKAAAADYQACAECRAAEATIEFGAGQRMCYTCASQAFQQIVAATPEPDVRGFMLRARRFWPRTEIVSDAVRWELNSRKK